jgi:hypothetical protein
MCMMPCGDGSTSLATTALRFRSRAIGRQSTLREGAAVATIKKGQLTPSPSNAAFWRHLREWKRVFWKRERKAARHEAGDRASSER